MERTRILKQLLSMAIGTVLLLSSCSGLKSPGTPTPETPLIENVIPLVSATGVVKPAQWARISMSIPGIVAEVLIAQGDRVEEWQVMVRLKGREDMQAAITAATVELRAAEKGLDDLNKAAATASTQALQAISLAARQVKETQYQLDNFTIPSNQEGMDAMQAVDAMKEKLDQRREAFEPYRNKPENDSTRKDLKEALDEAQSDYNSAIRRLELETALEVAQANLNKAREDYNIWKDGPDPKDVAVAQARLDNAQATLAATQSALEDLELRAPFGGTVSELNVRVGEAVIMGQPLMLLADLSQLRVETTDLNEIDAARVKVGQSVKVTFDALPDVNLTGMVKSIAPKSSEGAGVNYTVVVELAEQPETLRWGMTAFVDITVE